MTLTSALNSAMTGITAVSKQTFVVSDNIANALTDGYYTRSVDTTSNVYGGVDIGAVSRSVDPAIQKSVRSAEASFASATVMEDFRSGVSDVLGTVNDDFSLSQRLTDFESAIIEATSLPDSDARLNDIAMQAEELVASINTAADGISDLRNASENSISGLISTLEQSLSTVDQLNDDILAAKVSGLDTASLEDQRDNAIDTVNSIIPAQIYEHDNGSLALYTQTGTKLLDNGSVAEFSFEETSIVTPYMTQDNGLLSGLEIDGKAIDTSITGPLAGGELAAQFYVRDVAAVEAQDDLDVFAGNLIERFQDSSVDATLGPTDAGLFTDSGAFYDTADVTGIANRLVLNSSVSLTGDAETWRLRDGLNAVGIGLTGDTTTLNAYLGALSEQNTVTSLGIGTGDYTAFDMVSNVLTYHTQQATWSEAELTYTSTVYQEVLGAEFELGVDTDAEIQKLMVLETIYAANAQIIQAVDEMLDQIMGI